MKVLIVDDHAIVRDGLSRLLATDSDHEVKQAASGREALLLARSFRPNLVILDLVAFWKARRPEIEFQAALADDRELSQAVQETLYRIVQESLSNAVRHGAPKTIQVAIEWSGGDARVRVVNDGAPEADALPGYGLTGMAERVAAAGGVLSAGPAPDGAWSVEATLPLAAAAREEAA